MNSLKFGLLVGRTLVMRIIGQLVSQSPSSGGFLCLSLMTYSTFLTDIKKQQPHVVRE